MAVPIHLGKYMYIEDSDFTCMAASNKSHEMFCEVKFALSMIPPQPRIFTVLPSLTKASLLKALKESHRMSPTVRKDKEKDKDKDTQTQWYHWIQYWQEECVIQFCDNYATPLWQPTTYYDQLDFIPFMPVSLCFGRFYWLWWWRSIKSNGVAST